MKTRLLKKVSTLLLLSTLSNPQVSLPALANDNLRKYCLLQEQSSEDVARSYAQDFLDEWKDLLSAFRDEKLEAEQNLKKLRFQGDCLLDDIRFLRNDRVAQEGRYYWKLLMFCRAFEELDKSVEKYKDINWVVSQPKLIEQVKQEINDNWFENGKWKLSYFSNSKINDLSKCPVEFFAWLKIGLLFNELSVECRSLNITIHREHPDSPWQKQL